MPVTRPEFWPIIAITPPGNYAFPSDAVLGGWGIGAVFPSRDANWLHNHIGHWNKYADVRSIHGPDALSTTLVQRVGSSQLDFPTGVGLQVAPSTGGVYIIGGERVDLSAAPTTYSGVLAPTFAPSTTNYVHARVMQDAGTILCGAIGDLLVSTNAVEVGYGRILEVTTDATDITSTAEPIALSIGYEWVTKVTFADLAVGLLTFEHGVGAGFLGADTLTLQSLGADNALSVVVLGAGKGISIQGGNGETAIESTAGAGQIAGDFIASPTSLHALRGIGGTLRAVYGVGIGGGRGGEFLAGTTATEALLATGVDADADGAVGRTSTGASATAAGLHGIGRGVGTSGVLAESAVGRGLVAKGDTSATPDYAAMRIIPQLADPSAGTSDGELFWHADHRTTRTAVAGYGWRSMLTMGPGSAFLKKATQAFGATEPINNTGSVILIAGLDPLNGTGFYGAAAGAKVVIEFSCNARTVTVASTTLEILIEDVTNGATIASYTGAGNAAGNGFEIDGVSTNWRYNVALGVDYAPPTDGELIIQVTASTSNVTNMEIRNAVLTISGTYN